MEALHLIIASYLIWVLYHYFDKFVAIFKVDALPKKLERKSNAYSGLTDLLGVSRNASLDCQGREVMVFGIEIDISSFTAQLPVNKLEKAIRATLKVVSQKTVSLIDIQSLVGFLSLCFQAVRLGQVFMRRLCHFINHHPAAGLRLRSGEFQLGWERIRSSGTSCSQHTTGSCFLIQRKEKLRLFIPTLVSTH